MKYKVIILILTLFIFGALRLNSTQGDNSCVEVSNVCNEKYFEGYIKQRPLTKLYFGTNGKIVFLPYKKGDFVRKGQVLSRLDGLSYKIKKEKFKIDDEINYNIITAPYDGYIEEVYASFNGYADTEKPVIAMYPTNKTQAETIVDARYINKINLNKNATIECKNSQYEAKISNISKSDNDYLIELELNNFYRELKEGSNIKVNLDLCP